MPLTELVNFLVRNAFGLPFDSSMSDFHAPDSTGELAMLKIQNHFAASLSFLIFLAGALAAPAVTQAQTAELKLGTYDKTSKIYTCTDGNFEVSFPGEPTESLEDDSFTKLSSLTNFRFENGKGVQISTSEGIIGVSYAKTEKLRTADLAEKRRLAAVFREDLLSSSGGGVEVVTEKETKVPGASFAFDIHAVKASASTEFKFRIVVAEDMLFAILTVGKTSFFKAPEALRFADTFKLLNVTDKDASEKPTANTSPEVEGVARFTSEEDQFRVDLPGTPELEVLANKSGGSQRHWVLFSPDSVRYAVIVESVGLQGDEIDRFLGLFRISKILENGESKDLRADEKLELADGVKAVEIEMPLNGKLREVASIRTRFFVANGRVYVLSAAGKFADVRSEQANHFFDSFEIFTEESTPVPEKSPSPPGAVTLRNFTSVETGFSISLPTEPRKEESDLSDPTGRNKIQTQFISETSSGTYMVSHETTRGFILDKPELLDLAFQLVRDAQVERLEGRLLSEKEVQISSTLTGREYRITIPAAEGEYRTQVFFAEEQLFQIIAVGTVDFASSKQTDNVFKSFRLIDEASKSSPETALVEYNSALGGFKARLPSKPIYSRRTEKDRNGVEHVQHRYLCETEDNAVLISVTEFGGLCHNSDAQLHTMCESFVRGMAGKNKVEQFGRVQSDVNAHEWTFRHTMPEPGVKVQGRVVIANERFYIVQAIGDAAYLGDASTKDVIQSLAVTTEASKE